MNDFSKDEYLRMTLRKSQETLVEYLSKRLLREGFIVKATFSNEEAVEVAANDDLD